MGGRGSTSMSGSTRQRIKKQVINVGNGKTVSVKGLISPQDFEPDKRADIQNMFTGELSFDEILGTNDMDTAVLGAYGIQLNNLERKFGAIRNSNASVGAVKDADFAAAVSFNPANPSEQTLIFNTSSMSNIGKVAQSRRYNESIGWSMPTSGSIKDLARYTVTHEYGHLLHNQLYSQAKAKGFSGTREQFISSAMSDITYNAVNKYGGTSGSLSGYGKTNSREAFAESFANSQLGNPNAMGRAMQDWLRKQGF